MFYSVRAREKSALSTPEIKETLCKALDRLGKRNRVLVVPPDRSRLDSRAGEITRLLADYYGGALAAVLPATGTHAPLSETDRHVMFGDLDAGLFVDHDFRNDCVTLGEVPAAFMAELSDGACDFDWPVRINRLIVEGGFDLVISVGQVVPHEVAGMANYNKNILIGTGGAESIDISHYLGALVGMEKIMGRVDTPVRRLFNRAAELFLHGLPLLYIHTVIATDPEGGSGVRGLFVGDDDECFNRAAELSRALNVTLLDRLLKKIVVYLDPDGYRSAWLCNKGIYRARMAIADGGTLVVLAPGMHAFGEDEKIDTLIRKYGYPGTERVRGLVEENRDLQDNLSVAAHLIHGSTEGRFRVVYCPGKMKREEIEKAGYEFAECGRMLSLYDPRKLKEGFQTMPDGEEIYFIPKPALGLWAYKEKFK